MIIPNLILKFLVFRCLKQITSGVLVSFFHFLGSHDIHKSLYPIALVQVFLATHDRMKLSKSFCFTFPLDLTRITLCKSFGFDDVVQRRRGR